nr:hypothetical protein [Candidatus Pelagisphaera phototrophica]
MNTAKQFGKCGDLRSSSPVWRKVGTAKKGFTVWGEPNVEGPTSTTGQLLNEVHVNAVDVGTLFAVDFDTNEIIIEIGGYFGFGKRLAIHHVTPVASGEADREKNDFSSAFAFSNA